MNAGWKRNRLIVASAVLSLSAAVGTHAVVSATEASEARVRIVATLQSVEARSREVRLVTGTGLALRLVRAEVVKSCRIQVDGATARLADLTVGSVVRVECIESAGRLVAVVIEAVQPAALEAGR